jgi:Ca-activated chloride channel family protein
MRFEHPGFLLLLLIVIPLFLRRFVLGPVGGTVRFSDVRRFKSLEIKGSTWGRWVPFWLRAAAVVFLIVALARPQTSEILAERVTSEGVDIILTLDISGSMGTLDLDLAGKRNRLEVVKEVAAEFIDQRPYDRIGLVVFAGFDQTQCPLTLDHGVLKEFLEKVDIAPRGRDGTALGDALARTLRRLKDSEAKSKIVILLTDGLDNQSRISPLTAAEIAASLEPKIKVYTIGAGSEGEAPLPVSSLLVGGRFRMVPTEIDEETLQEIARLTDGKYFRARDWKGLRQIFKEIDDLETSEIEGPGQRRFSEVFSIAAVPALVLLLAEVLFSQTWFRRLP